MVLAKLFAVVLASVSAASAGQMTNKQDVIRINGVCINIIPGYEYDVFNNADYFRVNIAHNGASVNVYVGHNPEVLDFNRKWQARSFRSKMTSSQIVELEGTQSGQVLGIPINEKDPYFHIWFRGDNDKSDNAIKGIVGFCK